MNAGSKECNLRRVTSRFSRVLFERIPGTQGFCRVEPVIDLKQLNAHIDVPHFHMHTISSVLNIHILVHPNSKKYLRFAFENKVNQFRVLPFGLNTAPRVFTRLGHTSGSLPPSSGDIGNPISQ